MEEWKRSREGKGRVPVLSKFGNTRAGGEGTSGGDGDADVDVLTKELCYCYHYYYKT